MIHSIMSRRKFIAGITALFAALLGLVKVRSTIAYGGSVQLGKSKVVEVFSPKASTGGKGFDNADLDEDAVREMIHAGILSFTGENELKSAWAKIIPDPSKKVAIKINCQIKGIYTKAKVVQPLVEGLIDRGVPADNIIIYDRTDNAFDLAGFKRNLGQGVKVGKVRDFGGYARYFFNRLANLLTGGYDSGWLNFLAKVNRNSNFAPMTFLTGFFLQGHTPKWDCTYLINVPVLKALDGFSGVSLSLKNHYGSFANPSEHHDDIMDYIPEINALSEIKGKTRLIVLDAIFGEYKWINGRDQKYVSRVNKVLISNDPVAIDTLGWNMIENLRKANGLVPLSPKPVFIDNAAKRGIGNKALQKIDHQIIDLSL